MRPAASVADETGWIPVIPQDAQHDYMETYILIRTVLNVEAALY